jgi:AbrB family looped-hinge helix DNA binding protein
LEAQKTSQMVGRGSERCDDAGRLGREVPVAQSAVEGGQGLATEQIGRSDLDHATVRRYLTQMKTAISTKGQIVLPVAIREQDGIEPGQEFELERIDRGEYRLTRLSSRANEGVVDWLLACPQKGFFTPIESESTDDL